MSPRCLMVDQILVFCTCVVQLVGVPCVQYWTDSIWAGGKQKAHCFCLILAYMPSLLFHFTALMAMSV